MSDKFPFCKSFKKESYSAPYTFPHFFFNTFWPCLFFAKASPVLKAVFIFNSLPNLSTLLNPFAFNKTFKPVDVPLFSTAKSAVIASSRPKVFSLALFVPNKVAAESPRLYWYDVWKASPTCVNADWGFANVPI